MLVLGVTGQSGAGKGEFCRIMSKKGVGIACIDTDLTARKVVEPGKECLSKLTAHFGHEILNGDGTMNRKKVASIVFSDKAELEFLTKTTHKYIIREIQDWILFRQMNGDMIVIIDAPQLFDAGADSLCSVKLCVLAEREVRAKRIVERDGISFDEAYARIDSQRDDEYFKSRCEYVVYNNGNLEELEKQADEIFGELQCRKECKDDNFPINLRG